jgi:hypothetical protein
VVITILFGIAMMRVVSRMASMTHSGIDSLHPSAVVSRFRGSRSGSNHGRSPANAAALVPVAGTGAAAATAATQALGNAARSATPTPPS